MELDHGKLFIGGISWDTDEQRLNECFSKYGEVVEAVIMRDRATGRARGFGFITFRDPADAERAIMEKHVIDGRNVEAKKAVPRDDPSMLNRNYNIIHSFHSPGRTRKIFVGGLPSSITESDFKKYFDQFGTVTDVVVMYDRNTGRPRGFGFVTYDSEDAVDRAMRKTFHALDGKMVEVKRAVPRELSPGPSRSPYIGSNNISCNSNNGLSRSRAFLNSFSQGYNISPVEGLGLRTDLRNSALGNGRGGISAFGTAGYGLALNIEPGDGGPSTYGNNNLGYARMLNPYHNGTFTDKYINPIGYSSGRNASSLGSNGQDVWGNEAFNSVTSRGSTLRSLGGNFGKIVGDWGPSGQDGGSTPAYNNNGRSSKRSGGGRASPFSGSNGYESTIGRLYGSGYVNGDSTWQYSGPELDASSGHSFGYWLGGSDLVNKDSEGCVIGRQPNRGIAT